MDGLSDAELVDFIKAGRDAGDSANTTGIGMPAKGGNPSLSDDDILAIIAYIDSLK
jgi:cytochrome c5|tara:strand:+ start:273 stop:440 length:168 start_codon:yes stop_codon:yes gene_type:complete